jgi:hypothetical protein
MAEQQDERNQQTIGRYEVFMHGQDVVMLHTGLESIHILQPAEALRFLRWLLHHQKDLSKAVQEEEVELAFQ